MKGESRYTRQHKMLENIKKVLIVGAHYDDTELGAGGTAAKVLKNGGEVYKITLTDTVVQSEDMGLDIKSERVKENSRNACIMLGGVKEIEFPVQPYGQLVYKKEIMQMMEHIILEKKIDTVIFHHADDYNTDHMGAHEICKTAGRHVNNLLMFQSNPYIIFENFCPNLFVDISDTIEEKRKALACYDSEHDRWGRLFEANIQRNSVWGYGNHVKYAEGFCAIKVLL